MARSKTAFVCTECGAQTVRWQGQCPQCQAWNTMIETVLEPAAPAAGSRFAALAGETSRLQPLSVQGGEVLVTGRLAPPSSRLLDLAGEAQGSIR